MAAAAGLCGFFAMGCGTGRQKKRGKSTRCAEATNETGRRGRCYPALVRVSARLSRHEPVASGPTLPYKSWVCDIPRRLGDGRFAVLSRAAAGYIKLDRMKYIDLDALPWYTRQQVAEHQLDRAIRLLLDEQDAISSLTLAGAAEEIFGALVQERGDRHALGTFIDECLRIGRLAHGENWREGEFAEMRNFTRNALKHHGDGTDVCVTDHDAREMIDRALENLEKLQVAPSQQVNRYIAYRFSQ